MPHVQTSLQINLKARASLLAAGGVFDKVCDQLTEVLNVCELTTGQLSVLSSRQACGCGLPALPVLLSRASERINYRSLCVPDDLTDRGLDDLPQSFYAQDARRLWDTLHR